MTTTQSRAQLLSVIEELKRERDAANIKAATLESLLQKHLAGMRADRTDESLGDDGGDLGKLTLKQHAVVLAIIGGLKYQEIASIMSVDQTTVKLHLAAAMKNLGISGGREVFMIRWAPRIEAMSSQEYEKSYGIGKDWFKKKPAALMRQLARARPAHFPNKE